MTTANQFQDPEFIPTHVNLDLVEERANGGLLRRMWLSKAY